jgi:lactoylglutathione lyase
MPKYWYDHIHLISSDPRKTAQFYEKMFGAKLVSIQQVPPGYTRAELDLNGSTILIRNPLTQAGAPSQPILALDHFGIGTDNLEAAVAELKAKGVEFTQEIRTVRPGLKVSFLLAPDNVRIELLQRGG